MIAHSNDFKTEQFSFGRQYKNKIGVFANLLLSTQNDEVLLTEDNVELIGNVSVADVSYEITDENLYNIKLIRKGELLSTLMKELDFESDLNLDIGNIIDYQYGLLVNGDYEYLDYGKFIIYKKEYQNDTKTYVYTCYDFMLKTMVMIGSEFNFASTPTGADIIPKIATILGFDFDDSLVEQDNTTPTPYGMIGNLNYSINIAPITEAKITYRDLLNLLCQYFGVSMYMSNNDLKIKLLGDIKYNSASQEWYVDNDNPTLVDTFNESPFKDKNVTFKQIYGPINALNMSGTDETKTEYVEDTASVTTNGTTLFEVKNNLILNDTIIWETHSTDIANNILALIDSVSFNLCDFTTYGIMYLDWLDYYGVTINNRIYKALLLNSEITIKSGVDENIYTDLPEKNVSEYTTSQKTDDIIGDTIRARGNAYANGSKLVQENELNIYSTNEIKIGTWIDGKTLYRKVYDTGVLPDNTSKTVFTNMSNVNIINMYGIAIANNGVKIPLPYVSTTSAYQVSISTQSNNDISITTGVDRTNYTSGYIVLEYTK